jgi:hypothetical protein
MNIPRNAQFFIELAEKGKSFRPHTPRRESDRIGLFREICRACYSEGVFFAEDALIFDEHPPSFYSAIVASNNIRSISPFARYRLLCYFLPLIQPCDRPLLDCFL